jgi:hypothetical protein
MESFIDFNVSGNILTIVMENVTGHVAAVREPAALSEFWWLRVYSYFSMKTADLKDSE